MFLDEPESWRVLDEPLLRQRTWLQRSRIPQSPTDPRNTNVTEGNSCSCLGAIYATFIKALHTTTLCKQLNQPLVQEAALSLQRHTSGRHSMLMQVAPSSGKRVEVLDKVCFAGAFQSVSQWQTRTE